MTTTSVQVPSRVLKLISPKSVSSPPNHYQIGGVLRKDNVAVIAVTKELALVVGTRPERRAVSGEQIAQQTTTTTAITMKSAVLLLLLAAAVASTSGNIIENSIYRYLQQFRLDMECGFPRSGIPVLAPLRHARLPVNINLNEFA